MRAALLPATRLLVSLYALSGASGLCFELLWARQLTVVLGATSRAIAGVVALFMAGLALGSVLGARLSAWTRRPARAYGIVELSIGTSAIVVSLALPALEALQSTPVRYFTAGVLLLAPSTLMGLTFPLVVQAWGWSSEDSTSKDGGTGSGLLYGANTAGAALGCLAAGFVGVGLLGVRQTAFIAAAVNLGCGMTALRWLGERETTRAPVAPSFSEALPGEDAAFRDARPLWVGLIAFACGASALSAEVLWTRALLPYLNSSTYAFSAILSVFLLALAAGSYLATRWGRVRDPAPVARALLVLQLGVAVVLAASPSIFDRLNLVSSGYVGVARVMSLGDWFATVFELFVRAAGSIACPTLLMGASFALCLRLATAGDAAPASAAALVTASNTLGGIMGSALAGFVLLPRLGLMRSLLVAAVANLLAAALLALGPPLRLAGRRHRRVGLVLVTLLLVVAVPSPTVPFVGRLARGYSIVLVDEGPQDTTAVVERTGPGATRHRLVLSNGISYAGDDPDSRRYMTLLGHLPVLLASDPSDCLVICIGTGTTAAAVGRHPEVRRLDLVDISAAVHRTLPLFAHVNRNIWTDPRVRIHEADGRQFLGRSGRAFGAVTLEPPPPRAAGAASLYTVELYQRARSSMGPGGVLAQWLPLHGLSVRELRLIVRTFLRVFPEAALLLLNRQEAALVGAVGPLVFDPHELGRRLDARSVQQSLRSIGFTSLTVGGLVNELLGLVLVDGSRLSRLAGPGPVITDDRPLIEQFAVSLAQAAGSAAGDGRAPFLRLALELVGPLPLRGPPPPNLRQARDALRVSIWPAAPKLER